MRALWLVALLCCFALEHCLVFSLTQSNNDEDCKQTLLKSSPVILSAIGKIAPLRVLTSYLLHAVHTTPSISSRFTTTAPTATLCSVLPATPHPSNLLAEFLEQDTGGYTMPSTLGAPVPPEQPTETPQKSPADETLGEYTERKYVVPANKAFDRANTEYERAGEEFNKKFDGLYPRELDESLGDSLSRQNGQFANREAAPVVSEREAKLMAKIREHSDKIPVVGTAAKQAQSLQQLDGELGRAVRNYDKELGKTINESIRKLWQNTVVRANNEADGAIGGAYGKVNDVFDSTVGTALRSRDQFDSELKQYASRMTVNPVAIRTSFDKFVMSDTVLGPVFFWLGLAWFGILAMLSLQMFLMTGPKENNFWRDVGLFDGAINQASKYASTKVNEIKERKRVHHLEEVAEQTVRDFGATVGTVLHDLTAATHTVAEF